MEENYINGKWISGAGGIISKTNPNTGKIEKKYNSISLQQLSQAIEAAKDAFLKWSILDIKERVKYANKLRDLLIEAYGDEGEATQLKKMISNEIGKRIPEADIEVIESSDMVDYFASKAEEIFGEYGIELNKELWPDKKSEIFYEPYGVVGIIKAWNYPLEIPIWSIVPAVLAGNTVIFKPSEHAIEVGIQLAKLFDKAGFPKGVFNLVIGASEVGKLIVEHSSVKMISFTGSVKAGKEISLSCAKQLKKCSLELSGNDAAIVDKDINVELVANGLIWGAFCNSGQVCVGVKRVFIHNDVIDEVKNKILEKVKDLEPRRDYGPIISLTQLEYIEELVNNAKNNDGQVLHGGKRIETEKGFYFEPTIIENLNQKMRLFKHECFGPILPLVGYNTYDECIKLANNSSYGLGASVWTKNEDIARKLAKQLDVGMVWVNDVNVAYANAPWTGRKESGSGIDLSIHGMLEYVRIKHFNYEFTGSSKRLWWYPY